MATPRVRFGIQTGQDDVTSDELFEFWRFLDRQTSFHSVWPIDHLVPPGANQDPSGPCTEGWTLLGAGAMVTSRLRLGCLVSGNTYRHPALLAKIAATVDQLCHGRLEFGIGAAWHEAEHRFYGIPFPSVRERAARLDEAVRLIRLLFLARRPVSFAGRYYQLQGAPFAPACVQRPHPPIFVGGGGEKRTLLTAARYGDAINVTASVEVARAKVAALERHCADVGRSSAELTKSVFGPLYLSDDPDRAKTVRVLASAATGTPVEVAERSLLIGDAANVRSVVQRFRDIGVEYIIMLARPPYNRDVYRRISDEVVDAFA